MVLIHSSAALVNFVLQFREPGSSKSSEVRVKMHWSYSSQH
jgi:hypothetical protein